MNNIHHVPGYSSAVQQTGQSSLPAAQVLHDHPGELPLGKVITPALSKLNVLADLPGNDPVTILFKLPAVTALNAIKSNKLSLETSEGACACYSKDVDMKNAEGSVINTAKLKIHTIAVDQHNYDLVTVQLYDPSDPDEANRMTLDLTDPLIGVAQNASADTGPGQLRAATWQEAQASRHCLSNQRGSQASRSTAGPDQSAQTSQSEKASTIEEKIEDFFNQDKEMSNTEMKRRLRAAGFGKAEKVLNQEIAKVRKSKNLKIPKRSGVRQAHEDPMIKEAIRRLDKKGMDVDGIIEALRDEKIGGMQARLRKLVQEVRKEPQQDQRVDD